MTRISGMGSAGEAVAAGLLRLPLLIYSVTRSTSPSEIELAILFLWSMPNSVSLSVNCRFETPNDLAKSYNLILDIYSPPLAPSG